MTTQTGPRLTIAARAYIGPGAKIVTTCFPCEFLTHRGGQSYCRHEPMNGAHIGRTGGTYETPPDCPELPAARLALARSVVAEAPPSKADDRWFGGFIAALATIARYPAGMTAKGIMQDHGVTIADLRESQQGVPQEIDDIEASR